MRVMLTAAAMLIATALAGPASAQGEDLAVLAQGKDMRAVLADPRLSDPLEQAIGPTAYAKLGVWTRSGATAPAQPHAGFVIVYACEARACGFNSVHVAFDHQNRIVAVVWLNGHKRLIGNPPRTLDQLLLNN